MTRQGYIAVDLGAESGRVVLGALDGQTLWTEEVHRFRHRPLPMPAGLCWDLTGLWDEILAGLRQAGIAAKSAGMFSRINTMLSIPMLFGMVAAQNIY